ncbi:hypothetical protein D3C86_1683820 [compost metagenome]
MQGFQQIFRFHIFEQIPVCAAFQRSDHVFFMVGHAKHHDAPGERFFAQLIQRFQPVHARHIEIEQDQIRIE